MEIKEELVALRDVVKGYGGTPALGPVTLSVYSGEVLGIQGPNGAGKSTLMSVMAGVMRPDSGECRRGAEVQGATAYVPQELSLYGELTALENLRFWGIAEGLPRSAIRARSRWLLENLGLADMGDRKVMAMSGGMKRRLHLATALMATPRLLLLDEPTVGADQCSAEAILRLAAHFCDRSTGVVMISHRLGELRTISDRIMTIEHGVITGEERLP